MRSINYLSRFPPVVVGCRRRVESVSVSGEEPSSVSESVVFLSPLSGKIG